MLQEKIPRPAKGFCVKVELRMTPDKGLGSFAAQIIPANTKVLNVSTEAKFYDEKQALEYLASLSSREEKKYWLSHVYEVRNKIVKGAYDQDIVNHSSNPTIRTIFNDYNDWYSYALSDIEEGEELTEDYRNYPAESSFLKQLREDYGVSCDFMDI